LPLGQPLPPQASSPSDLLLDALAVLVTDGRAAAASSLSQAARVFAVGEVPLEEGLRWGWLASIAPIMLWDEEKWHALLARQLQSVREAGLLFFLPLYVNVLAVFSVCRGDFTTAASLIAESDAIAEATGAPLAPFAAVLLAGFLGDEAEASRLIALVTKNAQVAVQGEWIQWSQWVSAILDNSLGRYGTAVGHAQRASDEQPELYVSMWALPELIEAASRAGQARLAADPLERLAEATSVGRSDWGLGIYARSRALLSEGDDAENSYREAIERLSRTSLRPEQARAHLLYGEWLRREGRRTDAREQLRTAEDMFVAIGMQAFAERARGELSATGETARKRTVEKRGKLTPQEAQIARLARIGLSNPEIAARLFLSPRTVEYHLRKVFTKLEISSRHQLEQALIDDGGAAQTD
jgi:DNA-binding CsgD family transcriptional regulator